ncbi:MAG TPA: histidine kinase [Saprospiraceae bacterium]|nr:histidine kinase [Saprospiraceae bacterium]
MRFKIVILLMSYFGVHGQSQLTLKDFIRYSIKDGLIDNEVHHLVQDTMGYIWAGTENGLSRFDGHHFTSFTQDSDPNLVSGNYIEKLHISDGKLLVLAREGFSIIETALMSSKQYEFSSSLPTELKNNVYDVFKNKDGSYLISYAAGIAIIDQLGKIIYDYTYFNKNDVGKTRIYFGQEIFRINDTEFLIYVQDTKLYHFNINNRELKRIDTNPETKFKDFLPWPNALSLETRISDHELLMFCFPLQQYRYINTQTGKFHQGKLPPQLKHEFFWNSFVSPIGNNLYAINGENTGFYHFSLDPTHGTITFNLSKNLPEIRCYHILKDKKQKLWVATNKGVLMLKDFPSPFSVYPLQTDNSQNNLFISGMAEIGDTICIGMVNGKTALLLYDVQKNKILNPISFNERSLNRIANLTPIDKNEILISSYGGSFIYNIKNSQISKKYNNLPSDLITFNTNKGFVYLSSITTGKLYRMDKISKEVYAYPDSLSQYLKYTSQLYVDPSNNVWLAGFDLHKLHADGRLSKNLLKLDTKTAGRILCITGDGKQTLSMGTSAGTFIQYDVVKGTYSLKRYDPKYKLPITGITPVIRGIQFINAGDKFYSYHQQSQRATEISMSPEFPEEKIMSSTFLINEDSSQILTTTINHIIKVNLHSTVQSTIPPRISLISLDDIPLIHHPLHNLQISYNDQQITFHISNLHYSSSPVVVEYRLNDAHWHKASDQIFYNGLNYGQHRLYLRVTPLFGESAVSVYEFELIPPFYKSLTFISLLTILLISIIGWEWMRRYKANKELVRLNQLLSESEIKALHAQMNPHFIFNSLNSIKSLILHHKNDEASRYLSTFSTLIRQNLNHHRQAFITIDEQIEYIKKYLEMEKLRCPSLDYTINFNQDSSFNNSSIPPMIIQPIVENAIWHGHNPEKGIHKIIISLHNKGGKTIITVEDFGKGIQQNANSTDKGNSIALTNIKNRIDLYNQKYGIEGNFNIQDKSQNDLGMGTIVTFTFLQNLDE